MSTSRLGPALVFASLSIFSSSASCTDLTKDEAKSFARQEGLRDIWRVEVDSSEDGETDSYVYVYTKPKKLNAGSCSTTEHGLGVKRQDGKINVIHRSTTQQISFHSCAGAKLSDFIATYGSPSMTLDSVAKLVTSGIVLFGGQPNNVHLDAVNLEKAYKGLSRDDLTRIVINNDHEVSALFVSHVISPELLAIRVSKRADGSITNVITTSSGPSPTSN